MIIIDDIIPASYQDVIEDMILNNRRFDWHYQPAITYQNTNEDDQFGFEHVFVEMGNPSSQYYYTLIPMLRMAAEKINFKVSNVYTCRTFLTFPSTVTKPFFHTDFGNAKHTVFLYYVNNSTGPTRISKYNKRTTSAEEINSMQHVDLIEEIQPKKGRGVFFDGDIYHAASHPVIGPRCIINFNLEGTL